VVCHTSAKKVALRDRIQFHSDLGGFTVMLLATGAKGVLLVLHLLLPCVEFGTIGFIRTGCTKDVLGAPPKKKFKKKNTQRTFFFIVRLQALLQYFEMQRRHCGKHFLLVLGNLL
jgi:hypothetical protein